ncbi:ASCH domain-containing protein [Gordonia sp. NB41Y]|uniref:ASCH domain-containing protein n=1 Tax=Gordonia sp. NB41Y TaxID=875808 RepID=UPI000346AC52|nr:ASCH domain-containing protein [Gordonia sp. NB41Y]EMP10014.2 hypothetical protein ISGA_1587 [Gordonia sp. NB41Y]WLP90235.1 ASCH domain-containing protein [Gordonia sp. NB41Y]
MRAITVRQPWAWQIIHQRKDVENRTRNIAGAYRGPVAIHAALKYDDVAMTRLPMHAPDWATKRRAFWTGVILGVVDLVDVVENSTSEWAQPGMKHLVLANPRALAEPIPCKGALGLWTPPADVVTRLREA